MFGILLWCIIARSFNGSANLPISGAAVILGFYVYILTRRTIAQGKHEVGASANFAMQWQLGEAWLFLVGTIVAVAIMFFR